MFGAGFSVRQMFHLRSDRWTAVSQALRDGIPGMRVAPVRRYTECLRSEGEAARSSAGEGTGPPHSRGLSLLRNGSCRPGCDLNRGVTSLRSQDSENS